jgi:hypothetical protein
MCNDFGPNAFSSASTLGALGCGWPSGGLTACALSTGTGLLELHCCIVGSAMLALSVAGKADFSSDNGLITRAAGLEVCAACEDVTYSPSGDLTALCGAFLRDPVSL